MSDATPRGQIDWGINYIREHYGSPPPPYKPNLDAIRWIEDPFHGPSRPKTWRCRLIFWRHCPHREPL